MRHGTLFLMIVASILWSTSIAFGAPILFTNRALFSAAVGTQVVDDFSAGGYDQGDKTNGITIDIHSDAHMSAVLGETDYQTTGHTNNNIIQSNDTYCAGCNGSFLLSFGSTSVTTGGGVFGAGFDYTGTSYTAFARLADNTTFNYSLTSGFFGLTSSVPIVSLHIGLPSGGATTSGSIQIDNLTIASVPEPASMFLVGIGVIGLLPRVRCGRLFGTRVSSRRADL